MQESLMRKEKKKIATSKTETANEFVWKDGKRRKNMITMNTIYLQSQKLTKVLFFVGFVGVFKKIITHLKKKREETFFKTCEREI